MAPAIWFATDSCLECGITLKYDVYVCMHALCLMHLTATDLVEECRIQV